MAELKPCPFCGSKAKHFVFCRSAYDATRLKHNVQCLGKGCFANVGRDLTFSYDTEEEAVKAWNRRAGEQDG